MMKSLLLSLFLLIPCLAQSAPPNKPIYVTNYVYSYFNQTNWIYTTQISLQTNYVYHTNYVFTTNTVFNFSVVTNVMWITNAWAPPPPNLTLSNLSVSGFLFVSNSSPGLIQTFNGSNITGHLP